MEFKFTKLLKKFLKLIILRDDNFDPNSPFMDFAIPEEFLEESNESSLNKYLSISGKEYQNYNTILNEFRKEKSFEYLTDLELKNKLCYLICQVYFNRNYYNNDQNLKTKIYQFLEDIEKPVNQYEVVFRIENAQLGEQCYHMRDFQISRWDRNEVIKWGVKATDEKLIQYFTDSVLMILNENGNNPTMVRLRAKKQAEFNLKLLQAYLSESPYLHDEHLLLELSEFSLLKNLDTNWVGWGASRKRRFYVLHFNDKLDIFLSKINNHFEIYQKLSSPVQMAIDRTLFWIGESIETSDYDKKLMALCTAMETLLTTKSDKKKGEIIAYRMMILNSIHTQSFIDPSQVLYFYELRSDIVHGSDLFVASRSDYITMLHVVRDTLEDFIKLTGNDQSLTKIQKVITHIEDSNLCDCVLKFLNNRKDKYSLEIFKVLHQVKMRKSGNCQPQNPHF